MADNDANAKGAGKNEAADQQTPPAGRRTGPDTGNMRGNDLPSPGGTQRDGRNVEGDEPGWKRAQEADEKSKPGRVAPDARDLKERKDEAEAASPPRAPQNESAQPSGSGHGSGGETDYTSEPGI